MPPPTLIHPAVGPVVRRHLGDLAAWRQVYAFFRVKAGKALLLADLLGDAAVDTSPGAVAARRAATRARAERAFGEAAAAAACVAGAGLLARLGVPGRAGYGG